MGKVKKIIETERVIDEIVAANLDGIKQLNGDIKQMKGIEGAIVYDEGTP